MSTATEEGYFTEENSAEVVISRNSRAESERLKEVMASLTRHLHAFIKEVEPTHEEWMTGIRFLSRTGQLCTDWRQEFILLSDVLGVSMLVETINSRHPSGTTEETVLGPFHVAGAARPAEPGSSRRRRRGRHRLGPPPTGPRASRRHPG